MKLGLRIGVCVFLVGAAGCGGAVGPVVADIRWNDDGTLVATRCMLDMSQGGGVVTLGMRSCTEESLPPPAAFVRGSYGTIESTRHIDPAR